RGRCPSGSVGPLLARRAALCPTRASRRGNSGTLRSRRGVAHHLWSTLLCAAHLRSALVADRLCPPIAERQQPAALRAGLRQWTVPDRETACRVVGAAEEELTLDPGFALDEVAAALRADGAGLDQIGLLELALGIARAGDETAKAPRADKQGLATLRAGLVRLLDRLLHAIHLLLA